MGKHKTVQEKCGQCGKCCTAITFGQRYMNKAWVDETAKRERENGEHDTDCQFISENWEQITVEEVRKLRPDLEFLELFGDIMYTINWWRCKRFNPETKRCTVHEIRPDVCKGFPHYTVEKLQKDFAWYTKDCTYREVEEDGNDTSKQDN